MFICNEYILSQWINIFLLKESNSGPNKTIYVTVNQILLQEINPRQNDLVTLLKLALSTYGIA